MNENMKNRDQFKIYALDFANFEELVSKNSTVYVAELQRTLQHIVRFEVTAAARNQDGEVVEMVIDCGGGLCHEVSINNSPKRSEFTYKKLVQMLKNKGYKVERGSMSVEPVYSRFNEGSERLYFVFEKGDVE